MKAILATHIMPGFLDRLLARRAYAGQLAEQPVAPGRRDNLHDPVPGDHGAHGRFERRAKSFSWQFWLTTHRGVAAAAAFTAIVVFAVFAALFISAT